MLLYARESKLHKEKKNIMSALSLSEAMWQYVAVFFKVGKYLFLHQVSVIWWKKSFIS